jgi:hypothetical protein
MIMSSEGVGGDLKSSWWYGGTSFNPHPLYLQMADIACDELYKVKDGEANPNNNKVSILFKLRVIDLLYFL